MSASKKRRRLPEEDLAATVADIINSPITRSNLSFLRPLPTAPSTQPAELIVEPEPMAAESIPMGLIDNEATGTLDPLPVGLVTSPIGEEPRPVGVDIAPAIPSRALWLAEGLGSVFEQSRVRRIQQAPDALSRVEEKVYDLLWGPKNQSADEFRLVHYSLQRIATDARINIKTVRELLPRLIDKGFIRIEYEADVRRTIPTLYRVASYAAVLDDQHRRNRIYVAKSGKGVFYVHPVTASLDISTPLGVDSQPPGRGTTPPSSGPTTMGLDRPKPMGVGDTAVNQTKPETVTALARSITDTLGLEPDLGLLTAMVAACHQNAFTTTGEGATDEDLIYFTSTKARVLSQASNIRNHLAVLSRAVPECFIGETFRAYRTAAAARQVDGRPVV